MTLQDFQGSYPDFLIHQGQERKKKQEELAKQKKERETKGLPFSPQIIKNYKSQRQELSRDASKRQQYANLSHWHLLYTLGLEKPKYEGRTQTEVEYEREKDECTFKPNLHLTAGSKAAKIVEKERKSS